MTWLTIFFLVRQFDTRKVLKSGLNSDSGLKSAWVYIIIRFGRVNPFFYFAQKHQLDDIR